MNEPVTILVRLPLPLDVSATLIRSLGAAYPHGTVGGQGSVMVLTIPDEDRQAGPEPDLEDFRVPTIGELESSIESFADGVLAVSASETFARYLVGMLRSALDHSDAANYLEMRFVAKADGREFVVSCARSAEQTPHMLRMAAEERAERYAALLREHDIGVPT